MFIVFTLTLGRFCKMLRSEESAHQRDRGLQGCAEVIAGQTEPTGKDGPRDQLAQNALAPLRRSDVLLL